MSDLFFEVESPSQFYSVRECVGRGNFGDVYKAVNKRNNELVAIKVVNLEHTDEDIDLLAQEIFFLAELKSPYITNYITTMTEDVSMWIVMEYCGGGSCSDLIKTLYITGLPQEKVSYITRDILKGLKYLHDQKKIHRDIKAANILLTDSGKVKLGDFGVSGQIKATLRRGTFVGTPYWMAPEVVNRNGNGYNEKADIWSLGITVYELLKGLPPFSKCDPMKVMVNLPKRKPPKLHGNFSDCAKNFVAMCLIKDPELRPSAETLLKDNFVNNLEVKDLKMDVDFVKKRKLQSHYHKTPKFRLQEKLYDTSTQEIDWDFNTTRHSEDITTSKNQIKITKNIKTPDLGPDSAKSSRSSTTPTLNMQSPYKGNSCQAETPLTIHSFGKYNLDHKNQQKHEFESGMEIDPSTQNTPTCNLKEFDYLKNVITYSFTRMHERAYDQETKMQVNKMMHNFNQTEAKVPGFCEVLVEEISLRMNSINQYLTK